jgi:hypothetical protein
MNGLPFKTRNVSSTALIRGHFVGAEQVSLSHPEAPSAEHEAVFRWILSGAEGLGERTERRKVDGSKGLSERARRRIIFL